MSPLAEYVQEQAKAPVAPGPSPNLVQAFQVRRDRVHAMRESVAHFERIVEAYPIADAIENATLTPTTADMAASPIAIMRLPKARVFPWDRDNENSRDCTHKTCGVCCDRLVDGVLLARLPCGHEYHLYCVLPWLKKHCTCPECRYEMETANPRFEVGRKQRMKDRATVTCSCEGTHTCFFPSS
jgi:hypothetical protein